MLTPVDATTAGRPKSKPDAASRCHQASPASKSTGTSRRKASLVSHDQQFQSIVIARFSPTLSAVRAS